MMNRTANLIFWKIVYWLPRTLSIGFVLFLSMFALDVFSEYSGWKLAVALFMHLLPSLVLLSFIVLAWKYELIGAIGFLGGAIFFTSLSGLERDWVWYLLIPGPAVVVSILFLLSWFKRIETKF